MQQILNQLYGFIVALILLWILFYACCHIVGMTRLPGRILRRLTRPVLRQLENLLEWLIMLPFRILGWLFRLLGRLFRRLRQYLAVRP